MEDAHACVEKIESLPNSSYFGVFDGHGGASAAHTVGNRLLSYIVQQTQGARTPTNELGDVDAVISAMSKAYIEMDEYLAQNPAEHSAPGDPQDSGCTAVTAVITASQVVVAHIGDAR